MNTISKTYTYEITIKKSRFIAVLSPVSNGNETKEKVALLKKEHPKAKHVVHAAVWGEKKDQFSFSDDKEPKYTAGKPVFNILYASELTNCGIFIIRYFGGVLLGRGGLQRAYAEAAKGVLKLV